VTAGWFIILVSAVYIGLLFAIAYYGDKRADQGRSLINSSFVYALSIAVYCTSWTFYGSVGRATQSGFDFLPIYLGPTLVFCLGWLLLRKILRVSKANRITTIADFIGSRYGKNAALAGLVAIIAVIGVVPYIALQLKAVSTSFTVLLHYPELSVPPGSGPATIFQDTAFWAAVFLAAFAILFGTRHIEASEHHEGLVAAIAFESIVKLIAFLAVGLFVVFALFGGFGDLFERAAANPDLTRLLSFEATGGGFSWIALTLLAMAAIVCLPRQFQVIVVENVNERHLDRALWLFPLYLLLINIFVLPIALAGLLLLPGGVDPDTVVLTLPMLAEQPWLALLVFIGGFSAATGMVIVETVALSTMVSNDLVMPALLRWRRFGLAGRPDIAPILLLIRRMAIPMLLFLGYLYMRLVGERYALVAIGLISFAAVAQFFPAILFGLFWRRASTPAAFAAIGGGFLVWAYTLLLPSLARSGWLPIEFIDEGLLGIAALKPYALFGLAELDPITHSLFWSMLVNVGALVAVSLFTGQSALERTQAALFVNALEQAEAGRLWRGTAQLADLKELVARFLGPERAAEAFRDYARRRRLDASKLAVDGELVRHSERLLAGAIGSASARVMIATVAEEEPLGIDEVMRILDETSQVIEYSRRLEEKSRELEAATTELRAANERLKELDRLKDDFVSTVSHELRTPLTSIRSFSEILYDNPGLAPEKRGEFLAIIVKESERLTRLINEVLDLSKIQSGTLEWHMTQVDLAEIARDAAAATSQLFRDKGVGLDLSLPDAAPMLWADRDRLMQVTVNLLSNAVKFCPEKDGRVTMSVVSDIDHIILSVADNGPGIAPEHQAAVFERFHQVGATLTEKPQGTGLGLAISRMIVDYHGGRIWIESQPGKGAVFRVRLPRKLALTKAVAAN
jgi:Na+/proline symporter/nitrogen-specific signal transduction histidine kinase